MLILCLLILMFCRFDIANIGWVTLHSNFFHLFPLFCCDNTHLDVTISHIPLKICRKCFFFKDGMKLKEELTKFI